MNVYTRCLRLACPALIAAWGMVASAAAQSSDALERGFAQPPPEARLRAYWWWLNGNVTKAAITRDLEQMAAKGFGGALICDAGGADQDGNDRVPHGPTFFSPEWRELYRHALREADRLGLEMSLNIQSGWNLGGPMVKPEDAPKRLVWSEVEVTGPPARAQTSAAILPGHRRGGLSHTDAGLSTDGFGSGRSGPAAALGGEGPAQGAWAFRTRHLGPADRSSRR